MNDKKNQLVIDSSDLTTVVQKLPKSLHQAFNIKTSLEGKKMEEVIVDLMQDYVDSDEPFSPTSYVMTMKQGSPKSLDEKMQEMTINLIREYVEKD